MFLRYFIQDENKKKDVSSLFTVYPCRVFEQTRKKTKENKEINSENVYKKRRGAAADDDEEEEEETARTHVHTRCDKIEREEKRREDVGLN
jgi:hypothetical protein